MLVPDLTLEEGQGFAGPQGPSLDGDLLPYPGWLHVGEVHVDTDPGPGLLPHRKQGQGRHRVHQVGGEASVQCPAPQMEYHYQKKIRMNQAPELWTGVE